MSTEDQWEGLLESKQDYPVLWRDRGPWKPGQTRGETSEAQGGRDRSRGPTGSGPLQITEMEGTGGTRWASQSPTACCVFLRTVEDPVG